MNSYLTPSNRVCALCDRYPNMFHMATVGSSCSFHCTTTGNGKCEGWALKLWVNHVGWMTVVPFNDNPTSVRTRYINSVI